MTTETHQVSLSPTVLAVIEQFAAAMRADDEIAKGAVDRLELLLRNGRVPKSEEINAALFESQHDGET